MKRFLSMFIAGILIVVGVIPVAMVLSAETVIINETYSGNISAGQITEFGWSVIPLNGSVSPVNGNLGSDGNGVRMSRNNAGTSEGHTWYYGIDKQLGAESERRDAYMTVRRDNFKGKYNIELNLVTSSIRSTNNRFSINFGTGTHVFDYGRIQAYGEDIPAGLGSNPTFHNFKLETIIDTSANNYQTYYTALSINSAAEGTPLNIRTLLANGGIDTITANGNYITGLQFLLSRQSTAGSYVVVQSLKLTEIEKANDPTDAALDLLNTELLTSTPDRITSHLNLPTAFTAVPNVVINWSSSVPDLISAAGKIINAPNIPESVVMTAEIVNTADNFIQYADFNLTLSPDAVEDSNVLLDEVYKGRDYTAANLTDLNWEIGANYYGSKSGGSLNITSGNGVMMTKTMAQNTSISGGRAAFAVDKKLSTIETVDADPYMTIRREGFKGVYDVDLKLNIPMGASGYWRFIKFYKTSSNTELFLYRFEGSSSSFAFKFGNSGSTYFDNIDSGVRTYKTRLNTTTGKIQLFYEGSKIPSTAASGSISTFDMAFGYLDSIKFEFDERLPVNNYMYVESLKVSEIARAHDPTDDVLAQLKTSLLTSSAENVASNLNLPTKFLGVHGVSVVWSSSNPELISNRGELLKSPEGPEEVIMTAKIVNLLDNFTQYADFNLTVLPIFDTIVDGNKLSLVFRKNTGVTLSSPFITAALYSKGKNSLVDISTTENPETDIAIVGGKRIEFIFNNSDNISDYENKVFLWENANNIKPASLMNTQSFFDSITFPDYYKDPNVISDAVFFGVWNKGTEAWSTVGKLDYAAYDELSGVEECAKNGDYSTAKEKLLIYYRQKFKNTYKDMYSNSNVMPQYLEYLMLEHNFMYATAAARTIFTVGNDWDWLERDISQLVNSNAGEKSFFLVALDKDNSAIEIKGRKGDAAFAPHIEAVINGSIVTFPIVMDATISAGTNSNKTAQNITAAAPDTLKVAESYTSIGKMADPVDQNTYRTYLKFNLSGIKSGDTVSKAVIKLYARNVGGTDKKEMVLFESGENTWTDSTLTWLSNDIKHYVYSYDGDDGPSWDIRAAANHYYRVEENPVRFAFTDNILGYYQLSEDPSVLYELARTLIHYVKTQPNPAYVKNLDTALRGTYLPLILKFLPESDLVTADVYTGLLKYQWTLINRLQSDDAFEPNTNWGLYETNGMLQSTLHFEEFIGSKGWTDLAFDRYTLMSKSQMLSDYSSVEVGLDYVQGSIAGFLEPENIYKQAGKDFLVTDFPEEYKNQIIGMTKYLMDISGPGFSDHQQGDSVAYTVNKRARLLSVGRAFNDPTLLWAGTNGLEGIAPRHTSVLYPAGAKAVMRSDWSNNGMYMHINNDRKYLVHGHEDDLSVIVFAYGQYLLVDPLYYNYSYGSIRQWLCGRRGHNSIIINGNEGSGMQVASTYNSPGPTNIWETNNGFDFIEMTADVVEGVTHSRDVLFVKNKFWIVTDFLNPQNKTVKNRYEQLWHFLPTAKLQINSGTMMLETTGFNVANIKVIPVGTGDYKAVDNFNDNSTGIKNGYYSSGAGKLTNAEYASYIKTDIVGDSTFNTVLLPTMSDIDYNVVTRVINTDIPNGRGAAFQIDYTDKKTNVNTSGVYYNLLDKALSGERSVEKLSSDGQMFYIESIDGSRISLDFMGGTHIKDITLNVELIKSNSKIEGVSVKWDGDNIYLSAMNQLDLQNLTVYTNNKSISQVYLNGGSVSFNQQGSYVYFGSSPLL